MWACDLAVTAASGVPLPPDASGWFRADAEAAGVCPIRLHDLRRTHAKLMRQAGVPVKVSCQRR